jgi:hypothetical protein
MTFACSNKIILNGFGVVGSITNKVMNLGNISKLTMNQGSMDKSTYHVINNHKICGC